MEPLCWFFFSPGCVCTKPPSTYPMADYMHTLGTDAETFAGMMSDKRAPPHIGPFIWAALCLLLYVYRNDTNSPLYIWFMCSVLHISYVEKKRMQRHVQHGNVIGGRFAFFQWRFVLYAAQFVLAVAAVKISGLSWGIAVMQLVVCAMFFLEHTSHTSTVRAHLCNRHRNDGACKLAHEL